jgi:hypothetical protein
VAEEAGCCFLAIPLVEDQCVAISPFRITEGELTDDAARFLGLAPQRSSAVGAMASSVWSCEILERMATLFLWRKWRAIGDTLSSLSTELEKTSKRLSRPLTKRSACCMV